MSLTMSEFGNLWDAVSLAVMARAGELAAAGMTPDEAVETAQLAFLHARNFMSRTLNEVHQDLENASKPVHIPPPGDIRRN